VPQLEFFGQSSQDGDNIAANPARLVNLYREPNPNGGRGASVLKTVPGLALYADLPGVAVRALQVVDGVLYAVSDGQLYQLAGGVPTALGSVFDDADTTIDGNNGDVTICAGGNYYRWDGTTLTQPATGAFSDFGSLVTFSGYTVLTEEGGSRFQWSALADPSSLPGLSFSTADGRDDKNVRVMAINGALYIFKETSHEIWYATGGAGALAFQRQSGGVVDVGLKAHNLIANFPGAAFFIGDDNRAHIISGAIQPVSIPAVETAIRDSVPRACFVYEDEGHTFCVISFSDCAAWVYDVATGEWHERGEGRLLSRWTATCSAKIGGRWVCGRDDGDLYRFEQVYSDGGEELVREATSRTLYQDGQRFIPRELEIFPRVGFATGIIEIEVSRDGGLTWTLPKPLDAPLVGNYGRRVIWRNLGQCRSLTARIRYSEPEAWTMLAEGRVG
jgi:hypothetical protein